MRCIYCQHLSYVPGRVGDRASSPPLKLTPSSSSSSHRGSTASTRCFRVSFIVSMKGVKEANISKQLQVI
ncbi:hypothetical protein AKJ16_DCAP06002 [Drosera capensis]